MLDVVSIVVGDDKYAIERIKLEHTILYGSMLETITSNNNNSSSQQINNTNNSQDNNSNQDNNIILPVVECVSKEAIEDYIDFLQPSNNRNKRLLKECFKHCSIVGDEDYLLYNVKRLLSQYSSYKDILDDLNANQLRDIYLLFPLSLIPNELKENEVFFNSWLKSMQANINKYSFNGIEVDSYCTYKYRFGTNIKGTLLSMKGYVNNSLDGPQYTWYSSGNKRLLETYVSGYKNGPIKRWAENGVLLLDMNIKGGAKHGSYTKWFKSGRKKLQCTYHYNKLDGDYMLWANKTNTTTTATTITDQQELIVHCVYSKGKIIYTNIDKRDTHNNDNISDNGSDIDDDSDDDSSSEEQEQEDH